MSSREYFGLKELWLLTTSDGGRWMYISEKKKMIGKYIRNFCLFRRKMRSLRWIEVMVDKRGTLRNVLGNGGQRLCCFGPRQWSVTEKHRSRSKFKGYRLQSDR